MICHECNKEMKESQETYHYTECGLDNVFLIGVCVCHCDCGESFPSIPNIVGLNSVIGRATIKSPEPLSGKEVMFLRKNIGLSAKEFIKKIGVNKSTFSRWEHGDQRLSKANDLLVRLIYATLKSLPAKDTRSLLEEVEKLTFKGKRESHPINIPINSLIGTQLPECGICSI